MLIIFLDIDGVLLRATDSPRAKTMVDKVSFFEKDALLYLHHLISTCEAQQQKIGIVLSSDWRQNKSLIDLKRLFKQHHFSNYIVGKTSDKPNATKADSTRGLRIIQWLNAHSNWGIKNFVIFDDCRFDIESVCKANFVRCTSGALSKENVAKALIMLRSNASTILQTYLANDSTNGDAYDKNCINNELIEATQQSNQTFLTKIDTHHEYLLRPNTCCHSIFIWAEEQADKQIMATLKNHLAKKNLHFAVAFGQIECVTSILETDPSKISQAVNNITPLQLAIAKKQEEVAICLIDANAPITYGNGSTIHMAARLGLLNLVKKLIKNHPNLLNDVNVDNNTALSWAAVYGHKNVVEYLLTLDVNLELGKPRTALWWAEYYKKTEIATLIKAKLNQQQPVEGTNPVCASRFFATPTRDVPPPPALVSNNPMQAEK